MLKRIHSRLPAVATLCAAAVLVACDKVKTTAGKLDGNGNSETQEPVVKDRDDTGRISNLRQSDFTSFISRKDALVIVDFHAEWCGPCKLLAPVLEKATELHPGVVYLGKVDVDEAPGFALAQNVSGLPDVRIFRDGREVERFVGFPGEKEVLDRIAELSRGITPPAPAAQAPAEPGIQPLE